MFTYLVAEWLKGSEEEHEVYEFETLAELQAFRKDSPEQMKYAYDYGMSRGVVNGQHQCVAQASHYKQFLKHVAATGLMD